MISKRLLCRWAATNILVSLVVPRLAAAQTARVAAPEEQQGLQEIVVTAQKRAENLQQVPIAVSAASAAQLAASGVENTQDLPALVPGLTIRTTAGTFQPAIRGIGTSSSVVENPVALYIDGVYLPQQREGLRELNDIAQVAVLKGPQGTLFGRNATGGVIQITTLNPRYDFSGKATAQLGNYQTFKGDVYLTGGLSDSVAASLSAQYASQGNGWGNNVTTGNDTFRLRHQFSTRAKVVFDAGPDTSITFIGDYLDRDMLTNSFVNYPNTQLSFVRLPQLNSVYDSYAGVDSTSKFRGGGASVTLDQNLSFAKLLSITSYRKGKGSYTFDNSASPQAYFVVRAPDAPNEDYTEEIQLISPKGKFNWVTGAFYFHNLNGTTIARTITGPLAPAPTSTTLNRTNGREITRSFAPFAQADWEILPGTTLTGGARYTLEKRTADVTTNLTRVNGTTAVQTLNDTVSIKKTTVRAALSQQFTKDVLGYVSYNTGIKSGGFNILNAGNPGYLPEKLNAYEAGFKTSLLDRRLRLNVAGFYYDYKNVQVIQFLSGIQTIVNGASAKLHGVDIDFEAEITRSLRLSGGVEIAHSEFTSFPNAVFSTFNPAGGAIIAAGDAKGKRLPLAQELTATAGVDYHLPTSHGALDFNLTANYNGPYFFEPDNNLRQGGYVMLNTSLKWTLPGDRFSLTVWGKNLRDEHVFTQPTTQGFGYPSTYGSPPRTYGVTGQVSF